MSSFAAWKDRLLFWSITALVSGAVGWSSWATLAIMSRPTRADVKELVASDAPYIADRRLIEANLARLDRIDDEFKKVLERNTEAIGLLRIEIAKMSRD